jgi:arylsulfatase A-like enzyme
MCRRLILAALSTLGGTARLHAGAEPARKPDSVLIMADSPGWADVAFQGGSAATPRLDRLAREGLELSQHDFARVCSPNRTGALAGRCWSRFSVTSPQNHRALPRETATSPPGRDEIIG